VEVGLQVFRIRSSCLVRASIPSSPASHAVYRLCGGLAQHIPAGSDWGLSETLIHHKPASILGKGRRARQSHPLPGGGFGHGYGSVALVGEPEPQAGVPRLGQGRNAVSAFIPVARIADMLLNPGAEYDYNGQRLTYPGIRLVYWCGGNPFHHHQDLARLREGFTRPETVVVHDPFQRPGCVPGRAFRGSPPELSVTRPPATA
jgi:hypothetical protein